MGTATKRGAVVSARGSGRILIPRVFVSVAVACAALTGPPSAFALNPAHDVSQYMHTAWKVREGFTRGAINAITQTPDGYLWLGTDSGLVRFDGVRAVAWQPPQGQQLPSNLVSSLLVSRDGTLWIGTDRGLARWKDGRITRYDVPGERYIVGSLREDRDGTIWIVRFITRWTLCQVEEARLRCYGEDGGPGADALGLYEDGAGNLWVGTATGLWRWKPGPPTFYELPRQPDGIQGLAETHEGSLLVSMTGGIRRFADGKAMMHHPFPSSMQSENSGRLLRDRDGGLWIGTSSRGLLHVHGGVTDVYSQTDGLSGDRIRAMFEDREGNIWVATADGLDRFRESAVVPYSAKQGLSNSRVTSVLASTDGAVWLGTLDGLNRWSKGKVAVYGAINGIAGGIQSIFEDSQRGVWLSTTLGFGYLENDRLVVLNRFPPTSATRAIVEDSRKTIWIANIPGGLFRYVRGSSDVERIAWADLKRTDSASAVTADPSGDGLWVGFLLGGVVYFSGGQVRATYGPSQGLPADRVSWLYADRGSALWVATDSGLSRLKDGRVATLTSRNGLPCDAVGWVVEDADSLWLGMGCGLVRIARTDIDAWIAGRGSIRPTVFDHADGVRNFARAGYYTAPAARAGDGRLWFVSYDGVSVVDPTRLPVNRLPPPVHIEELTADRMTHDTRSIGAGRLRLPALTRDVQIDYTALSLVAPEKMRFRYKLENHDDEWQDVGTRRQAFYNDLRPGNYRFRVMASNNSGVWNEAGAFLDFSVAPAYYQTTWFMAASIAAVTALVWGAHRVRLRVVEKHRHEISALNERLMKAQEQERIRIAGELHDGVMQEMLAVTMMLGTAKRRIAADADAKATIGKIQDKMIRLGTDLRRVSHDLHPPALQEAGLPGALRAYCDEFRAGSGMAVTCEIDETARDLSRGAALALFRIAQEALGNAAKHAAARHVTVRVKRSNGAISLEVSDDGVGFDRTQLGGSAGLGLITMRERAGQLNGTFDVESAPGRGTTIFVTIPFR